MRVTRVAALALAIGLPAAAQAMSVAEFLAKADALKAKGFMAMMSPDLKLLKAEVMNASAGYRADLAAEQAAGKRPSSCPPPKGQAVTTSEELLAHFRTIPAGQRSATSVRAAFGAFMARRYPCKV